MVSAKGTRSNHITHQKSYYDFCEEYAFQPFPADEWRYVQYGQYLAWKNKVPETVDNYVGTVRVMHRLIGEKAPMPKQVHYMYFSEGLKKLNTRPVRQAAAMTHDILRRISKVVDYSRELHVVAFISLLVAFTMVLRVCNIGPPTRALFDSYHI